MFEVQAYGVVELGAELFKTVAAATRMKKRSLKPVDKTRQHLHIELDIVFEDKAPTPDQCCCWGLLRWVG